MAPVENLSPHLVARVADLLGRQPRGLEAIPVFSEGGDPAVIRVSSMVEGKPFPTLYWLVDPQWCYRIDQLEANGRIRQLQQRIDSELELQTTMLADHRKYIDQRNAFMTPALHREIDALGYRQVFADKGIGGISDFTRIRCLHTWYAAHLVEPNTVGDLLDDWLRNAASV